jgi:hypothetical protein
VIFLRVEVLSDSELRLTWTASAQPKLAYYGVYHSTTPNVDVDNPDNFEDRLSADTKSYTHSGLKKKTTRYYKVAAFDEDGNQLEVSGEAMGTTAKYSFEKKVISWSLVVAGVLLAISIVILGTYHPQNYIITFDGDVVFRDDNLSIIVNNQKQNQTKLLDIYGLLDNEYYIFSSSLVNKEERLIESSKIKFDNEIVHPLGTIFENQWKTVSVTVEIDALKPGSYEGLFIIGGELLYSIPVTLETPALIESAIILILVGVSLSVAMWEAIKHFKKSVDTMEATVLRDEAAQLFGKAEETRKRLTKLNDLRKTRVLTGAENSVLGEVTTQWPTIQSKAQVTQLAAANATNRIERRRARASKGLSVAARIGVIELASAGIGITIALIAMINNDFLNGLRVINVIDAVILIGIGLGIGSLKEFIDK